MKYTRAFFFFCCILVIAPVLAIAGCRPGVDGQPARLAIFHTNDTHAHLDNIANRCALTSRLKSESTQADTLLLDAGDVFAGTPYFSLYKGQADLWFMKYLKYDAMCLGNHEFDKGTDLLGEFVRNTDFPILCANFDFTKDSALAGQIKPWTIIERGQNRYGIFGLTTGETAEISKPGPGVVISDPTVSARNAVAYFKGRGVNKIIALTHIGFDEDIRLAGEVEGIDIIIGGHSHTVPARYPETVSKFDAPTLVVQAGCFNRYLGQVSVDFDSKGVIQQGAAGKLIAIDSSLPADKAAAAKLQEYKTPISKLMQKAAGCTQVALEGEGEQLRTRETNLGDLVADAMLEKGRYINAGIALINGGAIRSSMPAGDISIGNVYEMLPFDNYMVSADVNGAQLMGALENGVSQVEGVKGRFLQVAGLRYTWNAVAAPGKRIVSAEVKTLEGYRPVEPGKTYRVVTSEFVAGGGDGFNDIKAAANQLNLSFPLSDVLAEYLAQHSPVNPAAEGRITRIEIR